MRAISFHAVVRGTLAGLVFALLAASPAQAQRAAGFGPPGGSPGTTGTNRDDRDHRNHRDDRDDRDDWNHRRVVQFILEPLIRPGAPAPAPSGGGHGPVAENRPSPSPTPASCGDSGLRLQQPSAAENPNRAVAELSRATRKYLEECRCAEQQCVADALDQYAQALAVVAPRLPKPLRNLPKIVARAARRVRDAQTKTQAVAALDQAIAAIHKDISLVRSEDAETQKRQTRSGNLVAGTLNFASLALVNSGGL